VQNQNQSTVALVGLLFLIGMNLPGTLVAQSLSISGSVVDAETGEPLAYATVALKNEAIGTITNLAGKFDFHVPQEYRHEQIVFSTLGYVNVTIKVEDAFKQQTVFVKLEPGSLILDEVLVTEKLSAANLLKIAIARIEGNYPMTPVEMDGFYRETKKVNGKYVDLLEAAVKIYDKDYRLPRDHTKLRERVSLIEVRQSFGYDYSLNKYFSQYNVLEDLLLENFVKYRTFNSQKEFYAALKRKKVPGYNNKPINLVYVDLPAYDLKIYIDENYGIRKIVFVWGDGVAPLYAYRKSRNLENQVVFLSKQIEFQEHNGKLYLKYIAARYQNHWYNRKTQTLALTTERDQALLINQVNYRNPHWIKNSQKMKRYGLQYQHQAYNKEFWASYNTIKEMPLSDRVQFDLEKLFSLEEQFESYD
jgi:CarboxypepD_reg-like domain